MILLLFLILIIGVYFVPKEWEWTNLMKARIAAAIAVFTYIVFYYLYVSANASLPAGMSGTGIMGHLLECFIAFFAMICCVVYWIYKEISEPDNDNVAIKIIIPVTVAILTVMGIHHVVYSDPNAPINQPWEKYESENSFEKNSLNSVLVEEVPAEGEVLQDSINNSDTVSYD